MIIQVLHLVRPNDYRSNPANADLDEIVWNITFSPKMPTLIKAVLDGQYKDRGLYYKPVAKVSVRPIQGDMSLEAALEIAFTFTNSIDRPWTENAGIELLDGHRQRSTSVGDVMIVPGVTETFPYFVASFGFKRVDGSDHEAD